MKTKRIATFMLCLALLFVMGGSSLSPFLVEANAASKYSNVLDDLRKDPEFTVDDYPTDRTRNDLQIIQIAESENKELFIYVYQPGYEAKDYKARYINMSLQNPVDENSDIRNELYSLTYINGSGQFAKYLVDSLTVTNETYRYYNIATIYREFDPIYDKSSELIEGTNYVGIGVGLYFQAYYYNSVLVYDCRKIDVVKIEFVINDSIHFYNGFNFQHPFLSDKTSSHFVCFNVPHYNVEHIYDADITYTLNEYTYTVYNGVSGGRTLNSTTTHTVYLSDKSTGSNQSNGGWFSKSYVWDRITTSNVFLTETEQFLNESLDSDVRKTIENSEFTFRYVETPYKKSTYTGGFTETYSEVSNFGILRLHFATPEATYNLGCVSDLIFSDSDVIAGVSGFDNFVNTIEEQEWWQKIVALLVVLIILSCAQFIIMPLKIVVQIFKKGVGFCWALVKHFFSMFFSIFKKRKKIKRVGLTLCYDLFYVFWHIL